MGYVGKLQVGLTANKVHESFELQVARGDIFGIEEAHVFGRNSDADIATAPEDVWTQGGDINWPASATTQNLSSDSATDTLAGDGVRTVEVHGLDANWDRVSEIVEMDGTTPVTTTNSYIRINRIHSVTVGVDGDAAGNIYIYTGAAGGVTPGVPDNADQIWRTIPAGYNTSQTCAFSVPRNYEGFIYLFSAKVRRSTAASWAIFEMDVRDNAGLSDDVTDQAFTVLRDLEATNTANAQIDERFPIKVPEYADVKVRCSLGSGDNLVVAAQIEYLLVQKQIEVPPIETAVV